MDFCLSFTAIITSPFEMNEEFSKKSPMYQRALKHKELARLCVRENKLEEALDNLLEANDSKVLPSVKLEIANLMIVAAQSPRNFTSIIKVLKAGVRAGRALQQGRLQTCKGRLEKLEIQKELKEGGKKCLEKLALIYCQRNLPGDGREAGHLLEEAGFSHRLSSFVFAYPPHEKSLSNTNNPSRKSAEDLARIYDEVLNSSFLQSMQTFLKTKSSFWTEHGYNEFVNTGYFSYIFTLDGKVNNIIESYISKLAAFLKEEFPERARNIKYGEWWAHCRPHSSGHQLHYDSENEGRGVVRHPIFSTVLYLSPPEEEDCGGPTLMTNQRLDGGKLGDKGWIIHPKFNRLTVFDAKYLHGVIPGRGGTRKVTDRRITFMVGFWEEVTIHKEGEAGRLCPTDSQKLQWLNDIKPTSTNAPSFNSNITLSSPIEISRVWEDVEGRELVDLTLPQYDKCFQW